MTTHVSANAKPALLGVLLAGGLARRMGGGDKCRQTLNGTSLLARSIERASPQVDCLILNANGKHERFNDVQLPLVPDSVDGFLGPLAGVLSAMEWAQQHQKDTQWLLSFATDTPFFPEDLGTRLLDAAQRENALIAVAKSDGWLQPVFALWHISLAAKLRDALVNEGVRKIDRWMEQHPMTSVDFTKTGQDLFFNINRPEDVLAAEEILNQQENT